MSDTKKIKIKPKKVQTTDEPIKTTDIIQTVGNIDYFLISYDPESTFRGDYEHTNNAFKNGHDQKLQEFLIERDWVADIITRKDKDGAKIVYLSKDDPELDEAYKSDLPKLEKLIPKFNKNGYLISFPEPPHKMNDAFTLTGQLSSESGLYSYFSIQKILTHESDGLRILEIEVYVD